ncbi:MAG: PHP domain-containing protein [Bacilli bacterium]|nr:PHP domain-containing protein [Bacilli bacterium]
MENYKSASQVWLKMQETEDKLAIDSLNRLYFDNIINPCRASDKIIDLHTHTNYSDGDLSPSELIRLAIQKRIGILGITDHDTLDGIKKVDKSDSLIVDSGIQIIDGIELSAKVSKGRMHILGYDIDINDVNLNKKMGELKDNSINSVLSIMEQIKRDYGIVFRYNDIKELVNSNHNIGRPDLAKLCVKYGYASSIQDAFDKYLIEAHNKTRSTSKGLPYEECIELILQSKGIPILAHPKSLELSEKEFLILLKEMINFGLKGIEVYHSSHTEDEIKYYLEIANKYNLLISGGSDYHGPTVKPDIDLGTGKNCNIKIKSLSVIEEIKNRK